MDNSFRKKIRNKRGDIPITVLVIGVIAVCCMALFSFSLSTTKIRDSFVGLGMMEKINSQIENKTFYSEDPAGLYLEKNMTSGILFWSKQVLSFSVDYRFKP